MRNSLPKKFSNCWKTIPETPKDPILYFNQLYAKDANKNKVNLAIGAYADDDAKPWVLPSLELALKRLQQNGSLPFGYLSMTGDSEFTEESVKLAFGYDEKTKLLANTLSLENVARTQTLSGTGAVFTAYTTVQNFYKDFDNKVWTPNPTWPIHNTMANIMGITVQSYHYYDLQKREFDVRQYFEGLKKIPENSFVVLHSSGQNPTGFDISNEEWKEVASIAKSRKFLVLMDTAYQGFVSGDLIQDGYPVRYMAECGIPILVAQSYAKNMGLYGQRTGCLSVTCSDPAEAKRMTDFFGQRNRNIFSNPPRFGSDLAKTILKNKDIYQAWLKDIKTMADNINIRRKSLLDELKANECPGNWDYILKQKGMFAFTQLKIPHVAALREKYAIYMSENGRMSITGLNPKNVGYVGKAISDIVKTTKI